MYNAFLVIAGIANLIGFFMFFALPPTGFVKDPTSSPNDLGDPGLALFAIVLFGVGGEFVLYVGLDFRTAALLEPRGPACQCANFDEDRTDLLADCDVPPDHWILYILGLPSIQVAGANG